MCWSPSVPGLLLLKVAVTAHGGKTIWSVQVLLWLGSNAWPEGSACQKSSCCTALGWCWRKLFLEILKQPLTLVSREKVDKFLWFPKYSHLEVIFDSPPPPHSPWVCCITGQCPEVPVLTPSGPLLKAKMFPPGVLAWCRLLSFDSCLCLQGLQVWLHPRDQLLLGVTTFWHQTWTLVPKWPWDKQSSYLLWSAQCLSELLPRSFWEDLVFHAAWSGSAYPCPLGDCETIMPSMMLLWSANKRTSSCLDSSYSYL